MQKYIQQLKDKPEPVRKQIALIGAIIGSGIVAIFWITTLSFDTKTAVQETKEKIIDPFAAIKENAIDGYNELKANRPEEQPIVEPEPQDTTLDATEGGEYTTETIPEESQIEQ